MSPFCRVGDDGPKDARPMDLRGDEFRLVFMGERDFGGGRMTLPFRADLRTSVGSGIVPASERVSEILYMSYTIVAQNILSPRTISSSSSMVD